MNRFRVPLLLTLLGFAARAWRVDAQSLRGDEAFDVLYALQPVAEIIYQDRFNQIYPPLYHVLAHFWLLLAGTSQLSARFIALAASTLLVPLTFRFGRNLLGERAARLGALLVAVHPFLIWHAQDGRMYSLLAVFSLLSALWAERIWRAAPLRAPSGWWVAYVAVSALNVLNHYFAFFAVFVINVVMLYLWWRRKWSLRVGVRWFLANALIGAVALVWIALAWSRISGHSEPWIAPVSPLDVLWRSALAYTMGTTVEPLQAAPFVALVLALLLAGALSLRRGDARARDRSALAVLGTLAALPLLLIYLGSLFRPMYDEKYLIFVVPCVLLLAARGLVALGRFWLPATGVLLAGMLFVLGNYHFDARYAKSPPWRETAQAIIGQARPGDLVIYNYPDPALPYQLHGRLPLRLLPAQGPGDPAVARPSEASLGPELERIAAEYERAWFVPQAAPNWDRHGAVARWLERSADRDWESSFGPLRLQRYALPRAYQRAWTTLEAAFDDGIRLRAYRAALTPGAAALTLFWQADTTPRNNYTVFAHVLDAAGALLAQQDNPPVQGTYPTTHWQAGTVVVDRYVIIMPAVLPPGEMRFEVGMYDASGVRLRAGFDDKVIFGSFRP